MCNGEDLLSFREIQRITNSAESSDKHSVCGCCGGEILISRYTGEAHCIECGQLHELEDVWMFQPGKKPVVVKSWSPVEQINNEFWGIAYQDMAEIKLKRMFITSANSHIDAMNRFYWYTFSGDAKPIQELINQ